MAAPTFRAAGAKAAGTGASVVPAPTGVATGDLEFLIATTIAGGTVSITTAGGSAWSAVPSTPIDVTGGEKLYVWYRIRQAGDSDPTVTPGSDHVTAGRLAYTTGTFDTIAVVTQVATGTEVTSDTSFSFAPGNSTAVVDTKVLCIASNGGDSNTGQVPVMTNANLTGLLSRMDFCTNSGGGGGFGVTEGVRAAAGAIGTFACTMGTASPKAYLVLALIPVQPFIYTDSATPRLTLTPSGTDLPAKEYLDAQTDVVTLTPAAVEGFERIDASTVSLSLTVSGNESGQFVNVGVALEFLTILGQDIDDPIDLGTGYVTLTPSGTDNVAHEETTSTTQSLSLAPTGSDIQPGIDADTANIQFQSSAIEFEEYADSGSTGLRLIPEGTEALEGVTEGEAIIFFTVASEDVTDSVEAVEELELPLIVSAADFTESVEAVEEVELLVNITGEDVNDAVESVESVLFLLVVSATDVNDAVEAVESLEFPLHIDAEEHDPYFDAVEAYLYLTPIIPIAASDNFNRVNADTLGSNWTQWGVSGRTPVIRSNQARGSTVGGEEAGGYWNATPVIGDQYSQAIVDGTLTSGEWVGVACRITDANNYYLFMYFNNGGTYELRLYKKVSGSFTQLQGNNLPGPLTAGDIIRIEAQGTTIRGLVNDSPSFISAATGQTDLTGGQPGIVFFGQNDFLDNWQGGSLAAEIAQTTETATVYLTLTPSRSPIPVNGLVYWFVADHLALNNGDPVGTWLNEGVLGDNLVQATGSKKPTYVTNNLNGHAIVRFDGVDDILQAPGLGSYPSPNTLFMVIRDRDSASGTRVWVDRADPATLWLTYAASNNEVHYYFGGNSDLIYTRPTNWPMGATVFSFLEVAGSGGGSRFYENSVLVASGSTTPDNPGTGPLNGLTLGARNNDVLHSELDIAEIIIYNREVVLDDRLAIENYLIAKYLTAGVEYTDAATVTLALTPTSTEVPVYAETGTPYSFLSVPDTTWIDNFNDNSLDAKRWAQVVPRVFEQNQQIELEVNANNQDAQIRTAGLGAMMDQYTLTLTGWDRSDFENLRIEFVGSHSITGADMIGAQFDFSGIACTCRIFNDVASQIDGAGGSVPSSVTPHYIRMTRNHPGLKLERSSDGVSWTTVLNTAIDYKWMRRGYFRVRAQDVTKAIGASLAKFDNFAATSQLVEVPVYAETGTLSLALTPSSAELADYTETGELRLRLVPSAIEVFVSGGLFEGARLIGRIKRDYGYSGRITSKTGKIGSSGYAGRAR